MDATWKDVVHFKVVYPNVELMDELFLQDGRNVTDVFVGRA